MTQCDSLRTAASFLLAGGLICLQPLPSDAASPAGSATLKDLRVEKDGIELTMDRTGADIRTRATGPMSLEAYIPGAASQVPYEDRVFRWGVIRRIAVSQKPSGTDPGVRIDIRLQEGADPGSMKLERRGRKLTLAFAAEPHSPPYFPTRVSMKKAYFAGVLEDGAGKPMTGTFLLSFKISKDKVGRPVWTEDIFVQAKQGRLQAILGRHSPIPESVFKRAHHFSVKAPAGTGWKIRGTSAATGLLSYAR